MFKAKLSFVIFRTFWWCQWPFSQSILNSSSKIPGNNRPWTRPHNLRTCHAQTSTSDFLVVPLQERSSLSDTVSLAEISGSRFLFRLVLLGQWIVLLKKFEKRQELNLKLIVILPKFPHFKIVEVIIQGCVYTRQIISLPGFMPDGFTPLVGK